MVQVSSNRGSNPRISVISPVTKSQFESFFPGLFSPGNFFPVIFFPRTISCRQFFPIYQEIISGESGEGVKSKYDARRLKRAFRKSHFFLNELQWAQKKKTNRNFLHRKSLSNHWAPRFSWIPFQSFCFKMNPNNRIIENNRVALHSPWFR